MVLVCNSLTPNDFERLFHILICHLCILLVRCSDLSPIFFLFLSFFFFFALCCLVLRILHIFWTAVFPSDYFVNIFCQSVTCFFHSLNSVFHRAEVFNFNEAQVNFFSLVDCAFGFVSKKPSSNPRSLRLSLMLSPRILTVLHLTFTSKIYFIKGITCIPGFIYILFACGYPAVVAPLVGKGNFPAVSCL